MQVLSSASHAVIAPHVRVDALSLRMEVKKRLFLGNLPEGVSEKDVRNKFTRFGKVSSVEIKSKKALDGKESSTFGFVELFLSSEALLGACLRDTDGSDLNGMRMRVQVAKESFLSRLKAERESAGAPRQTSQRDQPQPTSQEYNPMQMFRNNKLKSVQESVQKPSLSSFKSEPSFKSPPMSPKPGLKKFAGTKTVHKQEVEEDNNDEEEGGNLMNKLEKFGGFWNDMDEAPVEIETHRKPLPEPPAPLPEVKVDPEEAKRKELDNQKRIQSLEQRSQALKTQHNLIKSALSFNNNQTNKKIIKFEDDDPPEPATNNKKPKENNKKKKQLFDEDELAEELDDGQDFKLRPHLDGSTGQELLELKSKFGNDSRFKLDHRFAEKHPGQVEEEELGEEKQRQMSILGSLVPLAPTSGPSTEFARNRLGTKAFVRFDPKVKDHVKFEKSEKQDGQPADGKFQPDHQPLPEVSSERYYKTAGSLDIGSGSGFSLRSLFQQQQQPEEAMEEPAMDEQEQDDTSKMISIQSLQQQPKGDWMKSAGMWHEPLFLQPGDGRFKEAMDFLQRNPHEEAYNMREKWADHRERLKHFYRNKMRRQSQWAAATTIGPGGKKRSNPAGDDGDFGGEEESSYQHHLHAGPDQPGNAKRNRRTFRR